MCFSHYDAFQRHGNRISQSHERKRQRIENGLMNVPFIQSVTKIVIVY